MIVGNDVVHLREHRISKHHLNTRFVDRIFTIEEAERIHQHPLPNSFMWSLWAVKEAAYKAVIKIYPQTVFSLRRFVVDETLASVRYEKFQLPVAIEKTDDWIHAVVTTYETPEQNRDASSLSAEGALKMVQKKDDQVHESEAVRDLALGLVAKHYGFKRNALEIIRPKCSTSPRLGPPELRYAGYITEIDISLSHDGPFVACAVAPHEQKLQKPNSA